MAPKQTNKYSHGKEIDALLNRLHSGCRFVDFEEPRSDRRRSGGGGVSVSNLLRNASPPDETHAKLGRALAHAYVGTIRSVVSSSSSASSKSSSKRGSARREDVVEMGEHIVRSLCRGEDATANSSDGETANRSDRANYASAACAFFDQLRFFFSGKEGDGSAKALVQSQWQKWCTLCEEMVLPTGGMQPECYGGGILVLRACLRSYGYIFYLGVECSNNGGDGRANSYGCARIYETLTHHSSRKYLIRTCVDQAFGLALSNITGITIGLADSLSPLLRSCVLSARKTTLQPSHHAERRLLLQDILRGCATLLHRAISTNEAPNDRKNAFVDQIADMTRYLTRSLSSYLKQDIHASFSKVAYHDHQNDDIDSSDVFDLGYDWLRGICDLMTRLGPIDEHNDVAMSAITSSIENITLTVLPQFLTSSTATFEMAPIYSSLVSCIGSLPRHHLLSIANATTALRIGSLLLTLSDESEMQSMCDLVLATFKCLDQTDGGNYTTMFCGGILTGLGCIFRCRPVLFDAASQLCALGESMLRKTHSRAGEEKHHDSDVSQLMDIITNSLSEGNFQSLMDIVSASISDAEPPYRPLALSDQCSGLLLILSLLHISGSSSQTMVEPDLVFAFLRSFLECYPRMASRAVPSIVDVARTCLASSHQLLTTRTLLASLHFLASSCIVSDPHGAHLAWTFLSSLANEGVPTAVRSSVIRLLPDMCVSNKRLFRRAGAVIGKSMVAQDPIIRISATAALSDMANFDLLRDVEQIVGWIQNRLTDEEPGVVYYALETLKFLVVNDELEFDLVIRVLEKRLDIDLSDANAVLDLDGLALEGLIALLGEGGLEEHDDDDESNDGEDVGGPEVSPQSTKAVSLLVELALSTRLSTKNNAHRDVDAALFSEARLKRRIYGSLSGYSAQVLGLDEESIRSWDGTNSLAGDSKDLNAEVKRFLDLKEIISAGLNFATELSAMKGLVDNVNEVIEIASALLESVTTMGKTILKFEEEVHGSFLFRGGSSSGHGFSGKPSKGKTDDRARVPKSVLSSLPSASSIQEMFESEPRSSSATAMFYSIGSSENDPSAVLQTEDILSQMSECFSDVINEPLFDPAFQAIQICSLMHCMGTVWKSIQAADESVREELLDQVAGKTEEWSTSYGGEYAYVAMSAFALSIDDSSQCWPGMTIIQNRILEGQENYIFESKDTKFLCLSMIAARLSRAADARVTGLIDTIEQSLLDSRQTCFGAFFGLGIIASNLRAGNINGTDPSDTWKRQQAERIICILLSAFNTCLVQENDFVHNLISSIKSGEEADGLTRSCSTLENLFIRDGSAQKIRSIMIGMSHSYAVLSVISSNFSKCVLGVVDKLPWGSGKSFVLYAAYKNASDAGVLVQKDISEAIATASDYVRESASGFGGALFSLAALSRLSSEKTAKELDLVAKTCRSLFLDKNASAGGVEKLMSILACCAAIGDLPGIASFTPNIYAAVKKSFVADIVKMLEGMVSDESEESKYRDAATIGLGILCAMISSSHARNKTRKNAAKKFESLQAKDGSVMMLILQEVEKSYSLLPTFPRHGASRIVITNKLCSLFSMLEPIAMPGNFSRVIELTLNDSPSDELELKASAANLLVSQLDPARRRIGFDGRGFVDLSTRLAKMPLNELLTLVGIKAIPIMAKLLPNLIYHIPTGIGEEVTISLWAICRADLSVSLSCQSAAEFLMGLKSILMSVNRGENPPSKRNISPALLRTLQKVVVTEIFSDLCSYAVPSDQEMTETVWVTYLQCRELVPSDMIQVADGPNCQITHANVFGMAVCASLSIKSARRVESWIALQEIDESAPNLRVILLSTLAIATHTQNDHEMQESVLSIFEAMLVKGIHTMALYLVAAKIAFYWESRQVHQLQCLDMPMRRISKMSSLFVNRNLSFGVRSLSQELLLQLFHSFVDDLPSKLAVLCNMWKISGDISNRASRIWNAHVGEDNGVNPLLHHRERFLACVQEIVQLVQGGEM